MLHHVKDLLGDSEGDFVLYDICSIEAVKAVSPDYTLLLCENLPGISVL